MSVHVKMQQFYYCSFLKQSPPSMLISISENGEFGDLTINNYFSFLPKDYVIVCISLHLFTENLQKQI